MIEIKARLELYQGINKRQNYFQTGYRPLFIFSNGLRKSGAITLLNKDKFYPGEIGEVIIRFIKDDLIYELKEGSKIEFDEGFEALGRVEIITLEERE